MRSSHVDQFKVQRHDDSGISECIRYIICGRVMRPIYPRSKKARNVNVDGWGKSVIEVDEIVNQDLFVSASFKISDIIPIL